MKLTGKNVVITGASSGIGKNLALQLAKEGCSVALLARRIEELEIVAHEVSKYNVIVKIYKCDVSNKDEVEKVFLSIKKFFGSIDIVVLNAGVSFRTDVRKDESAKAVQTFAINVLGMIYCAGQVVPDFIQAKKGMIVGVSSLAESRGFPRSGFYCASKAAASLYLESLRVELKKHKIKVLTVKPGFVKTPMTDKNEFDMPFIIPVEKAAQIIIEGIKKEKNIIQFTCGAVLGAKILKALPNWLFDFISQNQLKKPLKK
ncbi:MAG: SDR family NAD(P)-dependent oxidoreductase [Ignavibacteriaceae bacterium]|nr:SDR family NAD(P)-dependent oxidoreductase [Ignavibacteriaceae bacterium]